LRHLAVEVGDDLAGCAPDGFGLVAEEAGGFYEGFEFGQGSLGHGGGSGEAAEELGRDQVDAHVGALGGEDGGDEEFPRRAVGERALGVGIGLIESAEDGGDAFGCEGAGGGVA